MNRREAAEQRVGIFAPRPYLAYTASGASTRHVVVCSRVERYGPHRALCGATAYMSRITPWHPSARGVCKRCVRAAESHPTNRSRP